MNAQDMWKDVLNLDLFIIKNWLYFGIDQKDLNDNYHINQVLA